MIDPLVRLLEVSRPVDAKWRKLGIFGADEEVRAVPFEGIALNLAEWWAELDEEPEADR